MTCMDHNLFFNYTCHLSISCVFRKDKPKGPDKAHEIHGITFISIPDDTFQMEDEVVNRWGM